MMHSEDSTQDSVNSQNMGSVNGGTDDGFAYVQQAEDSSQSSELPGGKQLNDDACDGMAYSMQDYYNQMGFSNATGVAMASLESDDNENSNSRGFSGADDPQAQAYAEMMLQMQAQQQQQPPAAALATRIIEDGSIGFNNNDTRDSSNSASQNPDSVHSNGGGAIPAEMMMESSGQQSLTLEDSSDLGGATAKRKLEDVVEEESESNASAVANNLEGDASNSAADSPTGPTPAKKALLEINVRKLLPDLEKHWKPVEDDPNDFQAWTFLLQYVDQENELLAAREAYDAFLSRYPYCYGYWKKYADYEKRKGSAEDCEKVFRRGLAAISLSVDLWIHYLNYCKAAHGTQPDYIRSQYEAATLACGLEFRSDKLWEHFLQWELELNDLRNVLNVYDKIIRTPTQKYMDHFQSLKDFIQKHAPEDILSPDEYAEIKGLVQSEAPEELEGDELVEKIREKIVEKRTVAHKANEAEITARWTFEEAIKRPYFHVKPLEKGQLKMWKEYLEFEIEKGDLARVIVLFERCLIACALYEEYWIRYVRFLLTTQKNGTDVIDRLRDVFTRACTIHHHNKPWINLHWAAFEESQENIDKAVEILEKLMKTLPESIHALFRLVHVERRRGNLSRCCELFETFASQAKNKADGVHITIKHAQFLTKNLQDYDKAKRLLEDAMEKDESTRPKVVMALVNLALERQPVDIDAVIIAFEQALQSNIAEEQKVTFAHRKIEFLEEYGSDISSIEKAHEDLQTIAKALREKKVNPSLDDPTKAPLPAGADDPTKASPTASTNGGTGAPGQFSQSAYGQQYNQYGNYANWNYQQPAGYANYNQQGWSAYQGYYG